MRSARLTPVPTRLHDRVPDVRGVLPAAGPAVHPGHPQDAGVAVPRVACVRAGKLAERGTPADLRGTSAGASPSSDGGRSHLRRTRHSQAPRPSRSTGEVAAPNGNSAADRNGDSGQKPQYLSENVRRQAPSQSLSDRLGGGGADGESQRLKSGLDHCSMCGELSDQDLGVEVGPIPAQAPQGILPRCAGRSHRPDRRRRRCSSLSASTKAARS